MPSPTQAAAPIRYLPRVQDLAVRVELGPDASPEQITERMKQIAEERGRRRLTARVRRVMEAVA